MFISKRLYFMLAVSSLMIATAAQAAESDDALGLGAAPVQNGASQNTNGNPPVNTDPNAGANQGGIDFAALWNNPQVGQATLDGFKQAQIANQQALLTMSQAIPNAKDPASAQILNNALLNYKLQNESLNKLMGLYTEGSALARAITQMTQQMAQLQGPDLENAQNILRQQQSRLSDLEGSMTLYSSDYTRTQTRIDSEKSAVDTVLTSLNGPVKPDPGPIENAGDPNAGGGNAGGNHGGGAPDDSAKRALAAGAKADADALLADARATREAVADTLRASGIGGSGTGTRITEGRASRTESVRRARIGYIVER